MVAAAFCFSLASTRCSWPASLVSSPASTDWPRNCTSCISSSLSVTAMLIKLPSGSEVIRTPSRRRALGPGNGAHSGCGRRCQRAFFRWSPWTTGGRGVGYLLAS
jgi:hypothetical protein